MKKAIFFISLVGLLFGTVAATRQRQQEEQPETWEYKTMVFKVEAGESVEKNKHQFDTILNQEAKAGWQYAGTCCHMGSEQFGIDYVVLQRKVLQR